MGRLLGGAAMVFILAASGMSLPADAARIDPRHTYALRVRIEDGGRLMWINTERVRLRLDGSDRIRVRVDPVGG